MRNKQASDVPEHGLSRSRLFYPAETFGHQHVECLALNIIPKSILYHSYTSFNSSSTVLSMLNHDLFYFIILISYQQHIKRDKVLFKK